MSNPISVLIADDHPIFRKGLRDVIRQSSGMRVVAEATTGSQALQLIRAQAPDVAVLDVHMPGLTGVEIARAIQSEKLGTALIFLTMHKDQEALQSAADAGVRGYLVKDTAMLDIIDCIRSVAAGNVYHSPSLSRFLWDRHRSGTSWLDLLTPTERRVVAMIAEYKTSKEIAAEMGIQPRTVDNHLTNAAAKLGLQDSNALLKFAVEHKADLR
jgi:DNA-binding NarL/FixJ family response regulator